MTPKFYKLFERKVIGASVTSMHLL